MLRGSSGKFFSRWLNDITSDKAEASQQARRAQEKVAFRRAALAAAPHSAAAHEALGDALREADLYAEALAAYEASKQLTAAGSDQGSGLLGGAGLDAKIHLAQLDLTEQQNRDPSYIRRVAQRESPCRRCGTINGPNARTCIECGANLPVNTFIETWERDDIRKPILREVGQGAVMVTIVLIALYFASWMPIEIKGVLLLSTIAVLTWKGIRAIGDK